MRAKGFQSALTVSLLFHILFVAAAMIIARHSNTFMTPSPYVVSLVEPPSASAPGKSEGGEQPQAEQPMKKELDKPHIVPQQLPEKSKPNKSKKTEENLVSDRISALQAKKKIEKMASLRKIIEVAPARSASQGKGAGTGAAKSTGAGGGGGNSGGADYYSVVVNKIRQQWVYPETLDRDLEATIAVRIAKDGSVTIQGVEKGSGNRLFDRSVLNAIAKASPFPAPPQGIDEIGVRFRP